MSDVGGTGPGGNANGSNGGGGGGNGQGQNDPTGSGFGGTGPGVASVGGNSTGGGFGGEGGVAGGADFDTENAAVNYAGNLSGLGYAGDMEASELGGYSPGSIGEVFHKVGQWAKNNPGLAGTIGGIALGVPALGAFTGLMGTMGAFSRGEPGGDTNNTGGSGAADSVGGIAGLADAPGGEETDVMARAAARMPGGAGGIGLAPPQSAPSYDELYTQFNQRVIQPGSESYANPNLFSFGSEAYRYDPLNDMFSSVYSGDTIANPDRINQGIAAL